MNVATAEKPRELVFEYNMYADPRFDRGIHEGFKTLHDDAPDVFWTNENGGHWVITRADLMDEVLKDPSRFSSAESRVPPVEESITLIPLNLDPPEHTYFRRMLMQPFGPSNIKAMEGKVRDWAQKLVANVAGKGKCDFAEEVATLYPVSIFMELMGLPLERLREYRALVVEYFENIPAERRLELEQEINAEMRAVINQRRNDRRGDLISQLIDKEIDGRVIKEEELVNLCNLLFQAGMDTVANFAAYFFLFLARNPEIMAQLYANPDRIPDFVEEGFRLMGVVSNGRQVIEDTEVGGVKFRKGEIVICVLPLAGLDERRNPDPWKFDIDRPKRSHMLFSQGPHLCVGHQLARTEMRILLEEWIKAIPPFRIVEGFEPPCRAGPVIGLAQLEIEWDQA